MKKRIDSRFAKFMRMLVLLISLTFSSNIWSQQDLDKTKTVDSVIEDQQDEELTLSEIIPKASLLAEKLSILKMSIDGLVDVSSIEDQYNKNAKELQKISYRFDELKKEPQANTSELDYLKGQLDQAGQSFYTSNNALTTVIQKLEKSRKEWLGYQKDWNSYNAFFSQEEIPNEAKQALLNANKTIEDGLNSIINQLNIFMKLQQSGYNNESVINNLNNQILVLRQKKIESAFQDGSIPMYSLRFFKQFDSRLILNIKRGFSSIILPSESFFQNYGYLLIVQLFITLLVIFLIKKNSETLKSSTEYGYFNNRSISAGIFFGVASVLMFHIDTSSPPIVRYISFLIGGLAFCRLISNRNILHWEKQFIYALVSIIIITGFFNVFNLPVQLFRIFILIVSLIGIYKLVKWNNNNKLTLKSKKYSWFFNIVIVYLIIIVISEIIGKEVLALYMYEALLKTIMILVFVFVFVKMIQAGIIAGLKAISKGNSNISEELINKTVIRITTIVAILVIMLGLIPRILVYWNVYKDISESYSQLMAIGFNIGKVNISIGVMITSFSILYSSYIASTLNEMILMNERFDAKLDKGTRLSIAQLLRYFLVFFGFIIAISAIGFDLTNFTIVLSALSVGIGFGLQGLVNNFVSGLILLFERPIREGDTIEMEGMFSDVKKIGLRSTTVQTFDQSDVIIPNADLVYNKVTNWTLSNQRKRLKIAVGVAYGSDVVQVIDILKSIGSSNKDLVKSKNPVVLFVDFGDSTLNFELRVWAKDVNISMQIESDLRQEIEKRFRENNIEIAFPQRDLHIRSVDKAIPFMAASKKE